MLRHRGTTALGIALLNPNCGARWGWMVNATLRPLYFRESAPVPIVGEAEWAPGSVWKGSEKKKPHASTEVRTPGLPDRGRSLSRTPHTD